MPDRTAAADRMIAKLTGIATTAQTRIDQHDRASYFSDRFLSNFPTRRYCYREEFNGVTITYSRPVTGNYGSWTVRVAFDDMVLGVYMYRTQKLMGTHATRTTARVKALTAIMDVCAAWINDINSDLEKV